MAKYIANLACFFKNHEYMIIGIERLETLMDAVLIQ